MAFAKFPAHCGEAGDMNLPGRVICEQGGLATQGRGRGRSGAFEISCIVAGLQRATGYFFPFPAKAAVTPRPTSIVPLM